MAPAPTPPPIPPLPALARTGMPVEADRVCANCQYSLRGLRAGGVCPECGQPISTRSRRFEDNLTDAPVAYLRVLALSCSVMAVSSLTITVCLIGFGATGRTAFGAIAALASVAWWVGVFIATAPRPRHGFSSPGPHEAYLRLASRWTQAGWGAAFFAAGVGLTLPAGTPAADATGIASLVFSFVGLIGFVPLSILLADLGDWAQDTSLAARFRAAAWGLAICGGFSIFATTVGRFFGWFSGIISIFGTLSGIVAHVSIVVFLVCIVQLALMSRWAISNSLGAMARDRRLADKAAREAVAADREFRRAQAQAQGPSRDRPRPPEPFLPQGNYLERPQQGAEPYRLDPER